MTDGKKAPNPGKGRGADGHLKVPAPGDRGNPARELAGLPHEAPTWARKASR